MRARWKAWLVGVWAVATAAMVALHGCTAPEKGGAPEECTADAACDDGNPCTADRCADDGLCDHTVNDAAIVAQTPGNCLRAECKAGQLAQLPDPSNFADDHNSCTKDACEGAMTAHTPLPDGAPCSYDQGPKTGDPSVCKSGKCSEPCASLADCDSKNPCVVDSCDAATGQCEHQDLDGVPLPADQQKPGSCRLEVCQQGKAAEQWDNTNLPTEPVNSCLQHLCVNGDPQTPPEAIDHPCTGADPKAWLCDGKGACVECNVAADCIAGKILPPDTDCHTATCAMGKCVPEYTAQGTPVNATLQTVGNCQKVVCDGKGGTMSVEDDTNLPQQPINCPACTSDCVDHLCDKGAPSTPPLVKDHSCGNGGKLFCDGKGTCVACNDPSECGTNDDCKAFTCTNGACGQNNTPAGTLTVNNPPEVKGDCQDTVCDGNGGSKQVVDNNDLPASDGNQCHGVACSNGMPQHPNLAVETKCNNNTEVCDGNGNCVQCVNVVTDCNPAVDCSQGAAQNCQTDTCTNNKCVCNNNAANSKCAQQISGDCLDQLCDGMGSCNKTQVDNANVPAPQSACDSPSCNAGNPTHTPIAASQTNTNAKGNCTANAGCATPPCACDGAGTQATDCKSADSAVCMSGATCATGFCADGVCCNSACTASGCDQCNAMGSVGTCLANNIKNATHAGQCDNAKFAAPAQSAPAICSATGTCVGQDGATCTAGMGATQCSSTFCADGYCCNSACAGSCQACSNVLSGGANGTCANIGDATGVTQVAGKCDDTHGACAVQPCACNAAFMCLDKNGAADGTAADCASGFSADAVCCNSACKTSGCDQCNAAGSVGTCLANNIKNATHAGQCDNATFAAPAQSAPAICGPAGTCVGQNSATCMAGMGATQCNSGNCVDGVCCDTACNTTGCDQCDAAGSVGTCLTSNVKNATNPGDCDANTVAGSCQGKPCICDGTGTCNGDVGASCAGNANCAVANSCTDGYCCNMAFCGGAASPCQGCAQSETGKSNGTCAVVQAEKQRPGSCDSMNGMCMTKPCACDGVTVANGDCLNALGVTCTLAVQCASGFCVDGVCCNSACTGTCQGCSNALTAGANGTCGTVQKNVQRPGTCDGSTAICGAAGASKPCACDGAGTATANCRAPTGTSCDNGSMTECINGNCPSMAAFKCP